MLLLAGINRAVFPPFSRNSFFVILYAPPWSHLRLSPVPDVHLAVVASPEHKSLLSTQASPQEAAARVLVALSGENQDIAVQLVRD